MATESKQEWHTHSSLTAPVCSGSEVLIEKASLGRLGVVPSLQRDEGSGHAHFQRAKKWELSGRKGSFSFIMLLRLQMEDLC